MDQPSEAFVAAMVALREGRLDDAESQLVALRDAGDHSATIHNALAQVAQARGDLPATLDNLRHAAAADANDARPLVQIAQIERSRGDTAAALDAFRQAVTRQPRQLPPLRMLAALAYETGHFAEALSCSERMIELRPRGWEAHLRRGGALQALMRPAEAEQAYRDAMALKPGAPEPMLNLGTLAQDRGDMQAATDWYRKAIEAEPKNAAARINLAHALERLEQFEEAEREARIAADLNPNHFLPAILIARLQADREDYDEARATIEGALARTSDDEARGHLLMNLGLILDRIDRPDEAIRCFADGQRLLTPEGSPGHIALRDYLSRLEEVRYWPTAEVVAAWATPEAAPDDPVFLIGFPRSGTTLVEQILASHSAFETSDEKQILAATIANARQMYPGMSLPDCIEHLNEEQVAQLRAAYHEHARALVGDHLVGQRLIDKQPFNSPWLAVIRRLFPHAPIIIAHRDPRDACLSLFMQDIRPHADSLHVPTMQDVLNVYEAMMDGLLRNQDLLGLNCITYRYEEVVADTEGEARRLLEFLGEAWEDGVLRYHEHARQARRSSINIHAVTRPIYKRAVRRWERYRTWFEPWQPRLAPYVEALGYTP